MEEAMIRLKRMATKEGSNLEYLKNVTLTYMLSTDAKSKEHMLKAIGAVLMFTAIEIKQVRDYNASWWPTATTSKKLWYLPLHNAKNCISHYTLYIWLITDKCDNEIQIGIWKLILRFEVFWPRSRASFLLTTLDIYHIFIAAVYLKSVKVSILQGGHADDPFLNLRLQLTSWKFF